MGRGGVMMRWRMGVQCLGALALLFGLIAGYGPQSAEAQVTISQITNTTGFKLPDTDDGETFSFTKP